MESTSTQPTYPLVLTNLHAVGCVVVGGGTVAERKVSDLLDGGARPLVVSPTLTAALERWRDEGRIAHNARLFVERDVEGALLVFAATNDAQVNAAVAAAAHKQGCLVNIADDPAAGNFHTVASVRRGDLLLTISTGGSGPALAAHIRRELEARYGIAYAQLTALFRTLRTGAAQRLSVEQRKLLWQRLLADEIIAWLEADESERVAVYAEEQIELMLDV